MTNQELEIQRAEKMIFNNLPFYAKTFVLNSKKINSFVDKIESIIINFMNEDGLIDGKSLQIAYEMAFPSLAEWFSIPTKDFYLKDEVQTIIDVIKEII